jgi:xanthine dehydrogenase small subunit
LRAAHLVTILRTKTSIRAAQKDLSFAAQRATRNVGGGWYASHRDTYHLHRNDPLAAGEPAPVAAAREVGGVQIQNRGTLAGKVANASPAGDTVSVLAVMEATVVLASADGERRVPFLEFYIGYRATVMRPDELITAIEIPEVEGEQWFRKVGPRAAQAISKIVMAAVRGPEIRIAMGSVVPTVVRLHRTEQCLRSGRSIQEAQGVLREEIKPADDVRSTAAYRGRVASTVLEQAYKSPI